MSKPRTEAKPNHRSMEADARNLPTRGAENRDTPQFEKNKPRSQFLDLAGSLEGEPGLSTKRGFEK